MSDVITFFCRLCCFSQIFLFSNTQNLLSHTIINSLIELFILFYHKNKKINVFFSHFFFSQRLKRKNIFNIPDISWKNNWIFSLLKKKSRICSILENKNLTLFDRFFKFQFLRILKIWTELTMSYILNFFNIFMQWAFFSSLKYTENFFHFYS